MPTGRNHGLLIAGGGVSGSLAALAMARFRPEVPLLLVAEEANFGGGRPLLVFDSDLDEAARDFILPFVSDSWDGYYVAFPARSRRIRLGCHAIDPALIDAAIRQALRPDQYRTEQKISAVRDQSLLLNGADTLKGDGVLDARAWANQTTLELGWRKTFSRIYALAAPHRVDLPVLIDATAPAGPGNAFFACTPLGADRLRIEHVEHSVGPDLDSEAAALRIDDYVALRGWKQGDVEDEEIQVLPIPLGGDFDAYWRIGGARVAKLGARGGFFHPLTGSPLPDAIATALHLAAQRDFTGPALHDAFESRAAALWKKRELVRTFNRQLLLGGEAANAAFERIFALDAAVIARWLGGEPGLFERRQILSAIRG